MTAANSPYSVHILGFAGSLRQDSYNRALLRAARELAPWGPATFVLLAGRPAKGRSSYVRASVPPPIASIHQVNWPFLNMRITSKPLIVA
jgi:hypothetical protein